MLPRCASVTISLSFATTINHHRDTHLIVSRYLLFSCGTNRVHVFAAAFVVATAVVFPLIFSFNLIYVQHSVGLSYLLFNYLIYKSFVRCVKSEHHHHLHQSSSNVDGTRLYLFSIQPKRVDFNNVSQTNCEIIAFKWPEWPWFLCTICCWSAAASASIPYCLGLDTIEPMLCNFPSLHTAFRIFSVSSASALCMHCQMPVNNLPSWFKFMALCSIRAAHHRHKNEINLFH